MLATYLLPENIARRDGSSTVLALGANRCKLLSLTLGITRIIEQQSLDVSIWGSPNQENWEVIAAFPQKSYCGTYSLLVDLTRNPETRFLRAEWRMNRWGRGGDTAPLFGFYLLAEEAKVRIAGAA